MTGRIRTALRWLLALAFGYAGWRHLTTPEPFVAITPPWVPRPDLVVAATGIAEIAGAIGLMVPATRKAASWGLALYALCVWPANFHHALANVAIGGETFGWWYHGPRLAAQPLIIWWALWAGGAVEWPFGKMKAPRP
ncbi:DoxX family protein [Sphingopyxis sp. LK2115]|uniref:DoxX family protein n=1 Tax=Sphingopyxis sp. LK2115 TaxID=2744558 RepID=UPI001661175F|nr:DoxX family protein [Sphingopyxis sp. LK2115]